MSRNYRCVTAISPVDMSPHLAAWQELTTRAIEDNFYLTPAFLMATMRHHGSQNTLVVFVYRNDDGIEQLVAVAPFSLRHPTLKMPFTVLCGFASPHGYLSHPLVDRYDVVGSLEALWNWIEHPTNSWRMIFFQGICETSPLMPHLKTELKRRGRYYLTKQIYMRPMLNRHESFDAYLSTLPSARRKNYRRRWKQLENDGAVDVTLHRNLDKTGDLAERFLQLEQRSWKGLRGSALACTPENSEFFREIVDQCAQQGNLFFVELRLDGKLIAMTTNFIVGQTLFAFKIAYDPEYQDYSPGVLAEIQTVRLFHEDRTLAFGEGGATQESYLRSYWRDLSGMHAFYIAMPRRRSYGYLTLLSQVWRLKGFVRRIFRRFPGASGLKLCAILPPAMHEILPVCQLLA